MHAVSTSLDLKRLPSPALRRFAWAVLVYFIAVILWGTLVRATGAGAGCGNHWPLCNGTVLQHSASTNTIIEFTHRITSGLSFFSAVGLLIWTFAGTVRGHLARAAAVATVAFTLIEAILGALLVKLGLTAQSQSPLRPAYLALHLDQYTSAARGTYAHSSHAEPQSRVYSAAPFRLVAPIGAVVGVLVVLVVGVTGSLAALGDTLFPATSLGFRVGEDFSADQRMAGALALDASHHRFHRERLSDLDPGARGAALSTLGQSRPLRPGPAVARSTIRPRRARRGSARARVAAVGAPARRRRSLGRARRANRAPHAATGRAAVARIRLESSDPGPSP